jgi:hypothetical protein
MHQARRQGPDGDLIDGHQPMAPVELERMEGLPPPIAPARLEVALDIERRPDRLATLERGRSQPTSELDGGQEACCPGGTDAGDGLELAERKRSETGKTSGPFEQAVRDRRRVAARPSASQEQRDEVLERESLDTVADEPLARTIAPRARDRDTSVPIDP